MLRRHAADLGASDAIVSEQVTISHQALLAEVEASAAGLIQAGIAGHSVVGLTIADEIQHFIASLALMVAGTRQVTLGSFDPPDVRESLARRVGVTRILTDQADAAIPGMQLVMWPPEPASGAVELTGPAGTIFLRTSGTTGTMNITEVSADQLIEQASTHPDYAGERALRLASVEHNNSKRHRLYCLLSGGTNIFWNPAETDLVAFCIRHRVTCLDLARMHAANLAATLRPGQLEGLRLTIGGSPTPIAVRRAVERGVSSNLHIRYGATEVGAIAMAGPGEHDDDETVGRPVPGVVVEIVGEDGEPVPAGERGEIRVRAPGMAAGYFDNPVQSAQRFRDGWFWPGDMGRFREDGRLIVDGRRDDMMILNGINIFPVEIERVLEAHPEVACAAALPLPSNAHGQIPVAAVELRQGGTVTSLDLQSFARSQLALRAPRRVIILEQLPRDAQGKIQRRAIAAMFRAPGAAR